MDSRNDENLEELFGKFFESGDAKQAAKDIEKGEEILRNYSIPEPSDELIADIKFKVSQTLEQRKSGTFRTAVYKVAAVAAVFFILAAITVKIFERQVPEPEVYVAMVTQAIWEGDDIAESDAELATLTAEIEQVEGELMALQLGENGGNGHTDLTEIEMELIEIDSDFWKG